MRLWNRSLVVLKSRVECVRTRQSNPMKQRVSCHNERCTGKGAYSRESPFHRTLETRTLETRTLEEWSVSGYDVAIVGLGSVGHR
jgi:hypothetical protein